MQDIVIIILLATIAVPIGVYLSVKLGVVAFYRGKYISRQLNDEETKDGESEKT